MRSFTVSSPDSRLATIPRRGRARAGGTIPTPAATTTTVLGCRRRPPPRYTQPGAVVGPSLARFTRTPAESEATHVPSPPWLPCPFPPAGPARAARRPAGLPPPAPGGGARAGRPGLPLLLLEHRELLRRRAERLEEQGRRGVRPLVR